MPPVRADSHFSRSVAWLADIARRRPIPLKDFDVALDSYHAALARTGSPLGRFAYLRALGEAMRVRYLNTDATDAPLDLRTQVAAEAAIAYLRGQDLFPHPDEPAADFVSRYEKIVGEASPRDSRTARRTIRPEDLERCQGEGVVAGYRLSPGKGRCLTGAMFSTVFRARDLICGIEVALKVNRLFAARPDVEDLLSGRSLFEGISPFSPHGLFGLLNHLRAQGRYVVPVYDAGTVGELASQGFLAMKLMNRGNLGENLAGLGRQGREIKMAVIRQIAAAVEEQHDRGFIRLDLKPDNVLLHGGNAAYEGVEAGLTDLSIIRHEEESDPYTGMVWGVAAYLPVRVLGHRLFPFPEDTLDHKKTWDTFALGAVSYAVWTGRPVVEEEMMPDPSSPPRFDPKQLPPALRPVIMRAVSDDPRNWYPSGGAFRQALP